MPYRLVNSHDVSDRPVVCVGSYSGCGLSAPEDPNLSNIMPYQFVNNHDISDKPTLPFVNMEGICLSETSVVI
jgi:hypothetical protein